MRTRATRLLTALAACAACVPLPAQDTPLAAPRVVSGIDPALAVFNQEDECGIGAVVPWGERLWVITYAPHKPQGSSDKLYEMTPDHRQIVRPESIGGTPANRMIHVESQQLFIGPYVIDRQRNVRVIGPDQMFGRLTGTARHVFDPAGKVYFATMEEGIYEVDVQTLAVTELWADEQRKEGRHADLPGYHGKGLYSGQGRLIYANNGEHGPDALRKPEIPSGVLAEWDGRAPDWKIVRRNQFTEVTGPGGIQGSFHPDSDPVWAMGWDHRSLLLQLLDGGKWYTYRLPKSSHSYDGAHGWNTEWPRIRDIGENDLLMTMHGAFWRFPRRFTTSSSGGIRPRSNYLKVVGDFCRWQDQIVLGCDDAARSEFLNKRKLKGTVAAAGQSQSNLRFLSPLELDQLGPVIGRGAVWIQDDVAAGAASDPYLFSGYERRTLHLAHQTATPVEFLLEVDREGKGTWSPVQTVVLPPRGAQWMEFPLLEQGAWLRITPRQNAAGATAFFQYSDADVRGTLADEIFAGLARPGDQEACGGLLHARGADLRTLRCLARRGSEELGCYDLDEHLQLRRVDDPAGTNWMRERAAIPTGVISADAASVLFIDEQGKRWRLPKGDSAFDGPGSLGPERVCREVCTERDLLNVHGTFYELPAENAGGFARLRPIATHNHRVHDFTSYRGLLVMSGISANAPRTSEHLIRSEDGLCTLWVGCVDDLWKFGKPRGVGGPWHAAQVAADKPSDPYLMTGYDRKRLSCSHQGSGPVRITLQADFTGLGDWTDWQSWQVKPGETLKYDFPSSFACYWVRMLADKDVTATAAFQYD